MKRISVRFLVFLVFHIIGCSTQMEYTFKEEHVKSISLISEENNEADHTQNDLSAWYRENQISMCTTVRERFSLSSKKIVSASLIKYKIEDLKGQTMDKTLVHCPTIPEVWLHPGNGDYEVIVLSITHVAETYTFTPEFVKSIKPLPFSYFGEEFQRMKHWRENYLAALEPRDRHYFCYWAQKRVFIFSPDQESQNLKNGITGYPADVYKIVGQKEEEDTAMRCRTKPEMYLRLPDRDKTQESQQTDFKQIIVMFLEDEVLLGR